MMKMSKTTRSAKMTTVPTSLLRRTSKSCSLCVQSGTHTITRPTMTEQEEPEAEEDEDMSGNRLFSAVLKENKVGDKKEQGTQITTYVISCNLIFPSINYVSYTYK